MMYHKWLAALGLFSILPAIAGPHQTVTPTQLEIEDADTLLVEVSGVSYRIQLVGIDAPENVTNPKLQRDVQRTGLTAEALLPLGLAANEGLRELLNEFRPYQLVFDPQAKDRYGRTPGDLVDQQGEPLSLRLVHEGYAIPVGEMAQDEAMSKAATAAREHSRGLWHSHPMAVNSWAGITP